MLISLIITALLGVVEIFFSWIPKITTLPYGIDDVLVNAFGYYRSFEAIFWPIHIVFTAFMVYLGFRLGLLIFRLFLGSRTPTHN